MIETHIHNFIDKYELKNKTIIVGFSGGFDSMCLLFALNNIKQDFNLKLIGAHYNHNWRGKIAKKEQQRCEKFCNDLGIKFYTETAPEDTKKNETVAREQRYAFFERAQKKYNADVVFTAHNLNDNAETLIYRIAKGTGLTGLKGIQKNRDNYYRPLLEVSRTEIEKYCKENKLQPNIDNSNEDTVHKRNLIRHEILPLMEQINPNVTGTINNLSKITVCELEILDEYLNSIKKDILQDGKILTKKYKNLSKNLQQKIVYDFIYNSVIDYDYRLIENAVIFLNNAINNEKISKFSLDKEHYLYIDNKTIEIIKQTEKNQEIIKITGAGDYNYNDKVITISECKEPAQITDDSNVYVDLSDCENLHLRTRKDGDIIQPLGFNGTMKLKKYLISKKIPQHKRDSLILLCDDIEVLWVAGVGLSEKIKTTKTSTHKLQIKTCHPEFSSGSQKNNKI